MPTSAPSEDRVKRPLPPALGLMLSFAVAVAAIVAVVAVALIGHRSKGSSGVPAAARPLTAALAVLRRPQTAADRGLPAVGVPVVAGLTRLAATVPAARVYLIVRTPAPDRVSAVSVRDGRGARVAGGVSASELHAGWPGVSSDGSYTVSVVPDGVIEVRWSFTGQRPPVTVYPTVENNIAIAPVVGGEGRLVAMTWYGAAGQVIGSFRR
jgi:hypothetical protein